MVKRYISSRILVGIAATVGSLLAQGCETQEITVGAEGMPLNLERCYGVSTNCEAAVVTTSLSSAPARTCDETVSGELRQDFLIDLGFQADGMTLGDDGSVWVWGTRPAILRHYSAEGTLLGEAALQGSESDSEVSVAGDARGHAFVVQFVQTFDPADKDRFYDHLRVQEFDEHAQPLGAPVELVGTADSVIAVAADGHITVAGNATSNAARGMALRLDQELEPLWIQNNVPTSGRAVGHGISGLVVDGEGGAFLLSVRDSGSSEDTLGVVHLDADGNPTWDLLLPTPFEDGYGGRLASDAQGNLVVAGRLSDARLFVQSVTASGTPRWSWAVEDGGSFALGVQAETGQVFAAESGAVSIVSSDGESCSRYALPPLVVNGLEWAWGLTELDVSAAGQVYAMSTWQLARFSRLDAE
jgi:hypothetical protein